MGCHVSVRPALKIVVPTEIQDPYMQGTSQGNCFSRTAQLLSRTQDWPQCNRNNPKPTTLLPLKPKTKPYPKTPQHPSKSLKTPQDPSKSPGTPQNSPQSPPQNSSNPSQPLTTPPRPSPPQTPTRQQRPSTQRRLLQSHDRARPWWLVLGA